MPPLPKMFSTPDELRREYAGGVTVPRLLDVIETHQAREAYLLERMRDLVLATEGRNQVPAEFIRTMASAIALELFGGRP